MRISKPRDVYEVLEYVLIVAAPVAVVLGLYSYCWALLLFWMPK